MQNGTRHAIVATAIALSSLCLADDELTIDNAETAGISGFRGMWDTPVVTGPVGVRVIRDKKLRDRGGSAPWAPSAREDGRTPGALAFDAIHRSLLVRFPQAAEQIADKLGQGRAIEKVELILPFSDTELWPDGDQSWAPPEGGYEYRANWGVDKLYRNLRPTWHAVACALRKPWAADPDIGPTFNANINGASYWSCFGAQDTEHDRVPRQFGPTPVHFEHTTGRMDVTATVTDQEFGATLAARLRRLADCGFILRKWETYDHRYYTGCYEWATATGGRAIIIEPPRLAVTFRPATGPPTIGILPVPVNVIAEAQRRRSVGQAGSPTAVMPTRDELRTMAETFQPRKPEGMPGWQWTRVQELLALEQGPEASAEPFWYQFVPGYIRDRYTQRFKVQGDGWEFDGHDAQHVYEAWVDGMLGRQFRGWYGFEASRALLPWFVYRDAMPGPVRQWFQDYWTAWLMPDRESDNELFPPIEQQDGRLIHPMFDQLKKGSNTSAKIDGDSYFIKTGDWRGNKSFCRSGFTQTISTTNFNHTASMGALLGGAIIESERAIADGRHGMMNFPLKLWTWHDGSTQEDIDHYYYAISLTAQKMVADFGPEEFDRLTGRSMLTKSLAVLTEAYHPGLHRFIAGSSRTATEHLLVTQDGLYHILHTLSRKGVLRDLDNPDIPHKLPAFGRELPAAQVARQTAVSEWGPEWLSHYVDDKPLPYELTTAYMMWGGHREHPIMRRTFLGQHYGLYSANVQVGNIPIMAQWRRSDADVTRMQDVGTMLSRFGINRTRLVNDGGGWIAPRGNQAMLQHEGKVIIAASPWGYGKWLSEKQEITSIQSTLAFYNFEAPTPTWTILVDGSEVTQLPCTLRSSQRIVIHDGVTYIGIIPLPATDLGRTDEVVIRQGEPQTYYNRYTVQAALCIDNMILQRDEPLAKDADWDAVDRAFSGFVVEFADATEYTDVSAFGKHLGTATLATSDDAEQALHSVTYSSAEDVLDMAAFTTFGEGQTLDKLFTHQTINGKPAYLGPGVFRDSPLATQATTGRLEKNGAVLRVDPGRMAFLQTEPESGTFAAHNVLAELTQFALDLPRGKRIVSDGTIGLASVVAQPDAKRVSITHGLTDEQYSADGLASSLLLYGFPADTEVTLNGTPKTSLQTRIVDGQTALVLPLTSR